MSTPDTILASVAGTRLSLAGLLRHLRIQGRLGPLVREALAARLVQHEAVQAGLAATGEELQAAADSFRRTHGLHSAADTRAWLVTQGLSEDDFELSLEASVLAAKLREHLTATQVDEYFSTHKSELERLKLALVVVERDDLAREFASQVRDEGRDLESVARDNGLAAAHHELFRKQLPSHLVAALDSVKTGELIGPVPTPQGFALIVLEERRPAELSPALQESIQNELFAAWLADKMKEATFDLTMLETPG